MSRVRSLIDAARHRRPATSEDAGFGLVETIVAMALFAVLALSLLATLLVTQQTAYGNRSRVAAAKVAATEMDALRAAAAQGVSGLPIGVSASKQVDVAGTTFDVTTDMQYLTADDQSSACGQPPGQEPWTFLKVNVRVEWANMGSVQPVLSDAVITPTYEDTQTADGTVVVNVGDRNGDPVEGVTVRLVPTSPSLSALTSSEGCVIFTNVPRGDYEVEATRSGWIDAAGATAPTQATAVHPSTTSSVTLTMDRPATIVLTGPSDTTYPLPPLQSGALEVTITNPDMPGGGDRAVRDTGDPSRTQFANLFPHPAGYQAYAGHCPIAGASGSVLTVPTPPGETTERPLPYGRLEIETVPRLAVYAVLMSAETEQCEAKTYLLSTQSAPRNDGLLRASLPTGAYSGTVYYQVAGLWLSKPVSGIQIDAAVNTVVPVEVLAT